MMAGPRPVPSLRSTIRLPSKRSRRVRVSCCGIPRPPVAQVAVVGIARGPR